jgi:hypothetical protein
MPKQNARGGGRTKGPCIADDDLEQIIEIQVVRLILVLLMHTHTHIHSKQIKKKKYQKSKSIGGRRGTPNEHTTDLSGG